MIRAGCFSFCLESETDTAPSEPKKRKKGETPLKPALLEVLGDPEASRNLRLPINSKLIECWKIFMAKGLPAEEKEKIFKRYQVAEGLDAPKLNEALIPRLPEKTTKKDAYRQEVQSLISLALSTLSAAITMINEADAEDGLDEKVFTGRLMDTAKLLAEAQFSQTQSRRACIVPVFDKKLRQTLKDTTPDDRLFGTDLTNLIKQVKDTEALFDCSSKRAGNFKSAFKKKTPLSAQSGKKHIQEQSIWFFWPRSYQGSVQSIEGANGVVGHNVSLAECFYKKVLQSFDCAVANFL
ncbi:hypothetical protein TKK_0000371 [Trichogramma kaykai]